MENIKEDIENIRVRLRSTVYVARFDSSGTGFHVAEYGVHRHE